MTSTHQVQVKVHREGDVFWAESDDLVGFSACADSLEDLKALVVDEDVVCNYVFVGPWEVMTG